MPKNLKFKKLVHAREARTGGTYMQARDALIAERGGGRRSYPGEVTVVGSLEVNVSRGNASNRVRFEVVRSGVLLFLDDRALGEIPALVVGGKAHVSDGEYALVDGWGVRFEGEYEEPDAEFGIEGGYRSGGSADVLPPADQTLVFAHGRRAGLVSVDFRMDGSVCGSGGVGEWEPPGQYEADTPLELAGWRCVVTHDDGRYAALYFGVDTTVPEEDQEAVAQMAAARFDAWATWTGGHPIGINLLIERRPKDPTAYLERISRLPDGDPERRAFLHRVDRWLAKHDHSSGFALSESPVRDAISAVLTGSP